MSLSLAVIRTEALALSDLSAADSHTRTQLDNAIHAVITRLGVRGVAAGLAQAIGDYPETTVERIRWAKHTVAAAYPIHQTPHALRAIPRQRKLVPAVC